MNNRLDNISNYKLFLVIILVTTLHLNIFSQMENEAIAIENNVIIYTKNNIKSKKLYTIKQNEAILISFENEMPYSSWIEITIPRNKYSKSVYEKHNYFKKNYISGFIQTSKVKLIDSLELKKDTLIELIFHIDNADTSKKDHINKIITYGLEIPLNISFEVKEMYLKWKGELIKQDSILFNDLFNVSFKKGIYTSEKNERFRFYYHNGIYYIKQDCADGGGSYEITWVIKNGKIIQRLIDEI